MKMHSMKLPKRTKKDDSAPIIGYEEEEKYPYGLRIDLRNEQLDKLTDMPAVKVGDTVSISAVGKVIGMRSNARKEGEEERNVEIQITDVNIGQNSNMSESEKEQAFNEGAKS